jgi:hypothetical protein
MRRRRMISAVRRKSRPRKSWNKLMKRRSHRKKGLRRARSRISVTRSIKRGN